MTTSAACIERSPAADAAHRRDVMVGIAAALATVTLWAGWIVVTRLGVTATALGPADIGVLRYLVPALVLAPVLFRKGLALRRVGAPAMALIVIGAGIPFFLVCTSGIKLTPAAQVGAMLPGTMPLFVALLAVGLMGERIAGWRLAGFALVAAGVGAIAIHAIVAESAPGQWRGHLLLLGAAFLWAVYTHAFRRAGIGAVHATALVGFWSMLGFLPVYLLWLGPALLDVPARDVVVQLVFQGVLSGLVSMMTYAQAVKRLGASRAAIFSALTPVLATLLAIPVLGEWPDAVTLVGIVAVGAGVALASALPGRPQAR
ncbi:MAG: DMT family transporter [Alphaproteobacteria bacterium]|nr:DMT family transporter [Alphaproteobacteria bacterium]